MLLMEDSVWNLKEKTTQHLFSYFQNARKYLKSLMTYMYPLDIIIDNFNI